jgi:hypothetical protein
MTQPFRFLWRMLGFLLAVLLVAAMLGAPLAQAFAANPVLNGVILGALLFGIAWNLRQVVLLRAEVDWLEGFRAPRSGAPARPAPRLLAPMAAMFAARPSGRHTISAAGMRSVLDGISSRLDESRELSRYMTGLLIFLGLLGTFWGLLLTIGSIADVISGMSLAGGDINALFNQLKAGLAQPLRGMGVAFSSSMLGLAGALVLGFLDLTAGQAQNRFYTELEDWLAGLTRLSSGIGPEGEGAVPAYVGALLEQTAENLDSLQGIIARGEEARGQTSAALVQLADRLSVLTDQMRANQALMQRVADAQAMLRPALLAIAEGSAQPVLDEASRAHLRNTELLLARLVEETAHGRVQATGELRQEIRVLARTLAATQDARPAG